MPDRAAIARLKARQEVLRAELAAAGLATPQAIREAYEAMDASERDAIESRLDGPAATAALGKALRRNLSRRL